MLSCVLIIPAAQKDAANALGKAMGWGPDNYTVALTNGKTVTHWGLHAWVEPSFVEMLSAAPDGVDEAAYKAVVSALIKSVRPDSDGHFAAVIADNGLSMVGEE